VGSLSDETTEKDLEGAAATVTNGAVFSKDRRYRYALWRTWEAGDGYVVFIGTNPSTADETTNDPTIRRCVGFAKEWGYQALLMLNLSAYRATDPFLLKYQDDPIGPDNDEVLSRLTADAGMVVAAWGNHGPVQRVEAVRSLITKPLWCLGTNKSGSPKHPLYVRQDVEPLPWLSLA
jgi:hypothetical protein